MKELSIEEKAKRYDEALAKAAKIHRNYKGRVRAVDIVIEEVFPELKESEDERIRKRICKLLWDNAPYEEAQEYITWLEKQNEQKPVIEMKTPEESLGIDSDTYNKIVDECVYGEQKHTDNVEPKFHEGEWVIDKQGIVHQISNVIENVTNHTYAYDIVGGGYFNDNTEGVKLWTIQDAKDGDVLAWDDSKCIAIFKNIYDENSFNSYGFVGGCTDSFESRQSYHDIEGAHPATKEQRDQLEKAMADAGYTFDLEKKELIKIKQNVTSKFKIGDNIKPIDSCLGSSRTIYKICDGFYETNQGTLDFEFENNWRLIEQKPAWSEEDERIYMSIMYSFAHNYPLTIQQQEFVKSIKERVQLQPKQEWTEEDELIIKRIKSLLYSINENDFKDIYAWLEFLKNRVQSKQEWSKEDEGYYDAIIAKLEVTREDALLTDNEMDFLKSLEKRVFPKSNWNEEDEKVIHCLEYTIRHFYVDEDTIEWCCDWLKSLRPQNRWKPSEEQMIAIQDAMNIVGVLTITGSKINSLYQDLKKLI